MVKGLQKRGPPVLRNLGASRLHDLINILIYEKQWLEESSQMFPFRLNLPGKPDCTFPASTEEGQSSTSTFCHHTTEPEVKSASSTEETKLGDAKHHWDENIADRNNMGRANATAHHPNFEVLKDWLVMMIKDHESISVSNLRMFFRQEFNKKLDCQSYGFSTVEDLIAACSDDINVIVEDSVTSIEFNPKDEPKELSRREVVNNCQKLLEEVLENNPDGYYISCFKSLFFQKYGYTLDQKMLGYAKLSSFLQAMPKVEVQSSIIYSSEKFHNKVNDKEKKMYYNLDQSSKEERGTTEKDANTEERNSVSKVVSEEDKPTCANAMNNEEAVWEELGPIVMEGSAKYVSSSNMNLQLNGSHYDGLQVEEQKELKESSMQSCGDSNTVKCDPEWTKPCNERKSNLQSGECKSILQVLDAWYKGSDQFSTQCTEKLDGLVDCSAYDNSLDSSESQTVPAGEAYLSWIVGCSAAIGIKIGVLHPIEIFIIQGAGKSISLFTTEEDGSNCGTFNVGTCNVQTGVWVALHMLNSQKNHPSVIDIHPGIAQAMLKMDVLIRSILATLEHGKMEHRFCLEHVERYAQMQSCLLECFDCRVHPEWWNGVIPKVQ
eukprot:Gb_38161 [translate_table: standard]